MDHGRAGSGPRQAAVSWGSERSRQISAVPVRMASRPSGIDPVQARLGRDVIELVQRGRMILDLAEADYEEVVGRRGHDREAAWQCRNTLTEASQSWQRLVEDLGMDTVQTALRQPSQSAIHLESVGHKGQTISLILIGGSTYTVMREPGVELAPVQWRVARLKPNVEPDPYYVCRLANGTFQCDCAEWIYRIAETDRLRTTHCKHSAALHALGWI